MSSFDPMATAIDWLDAYRANDIEALLRMYAPQAVIRCACGGLTTISGAECRSDYWTQRLKEYPASRLANLQPAGDGALISYEVRESLVSTVLRFDANGRIKSHTCGPSD